MKYWKYKTLHLKGKDDLEDALAASGAEGWELVCLIPVIEGVGLMFKQEDTVRALQERMVHNALRNEIREEMAQMAEDFRKLTDL